MSNDAISATNNGFDYLRNDRSDLFISRVAPRCGMTPCQNVAGQTGIPSRRQGSSWVHASLGLQGIEGCGLGVVAMDDIARETLLIMYGGMVITAAEFAALPEELQHFPFQIADDLFLSPIDENDIGISERLNHSCSPNAGFSGAIAVVSLRDIAKGEPITIDYATCVASDDDAFQLECQCGASDCRKVITGQDWKMKNIQQRLHKHFQPFLQDKIKKN